MNITVDWLLSDYRVFFIDAYGVLVNTSGALPGATDFLARLRQRSCTVLVLTNDASRLPETCAERYGRFGLNISSDDILTSGSLLRDWVQRHGLGGEGCIVLGTSDSVEYARRAGLVPADPRDESASVLAVCDDDGYPMRDTIDAALTVSFRRLDRGEPMHLVLPNPDLIYPSGERSYGITSGSVALVFEAALAMRYPRRELSFERLGKPHAPMFAAAMRRADLEDPAEAVMLGDQLGTDIRGANDFGIPSVLLGSGLTRLETLQDSDVQPTWVLPHLV